MPSWCLDPTRLVRDFDGPGSVDSQNSSLSALLCVPHYPAEDDIARTRESIQSTLINHEIIEDPTATPSFEYIVIGGGTAGLALASRLAESLEPGQHVCVIEAGLYRQDVVVDVPGAYGLALGDKDYDWSYRTVPQPNLDDRQVPCNAGRLLGGSSGINFITRIRASSPEYDAWDEFGSGWNWKGLLPYFKVEECYETYAWGTDQIFPGITKGEDEEARRRESEYHGYHRGAVSSTHNTIYTDLLKPTIETTLKFGIQTNRTPGHGDSTGMFNIDTAVNRKEGTRSYAANAYLQDPKSTLAQKNVVVLSGVYAAKIFFDSNGSAQNARAVGVTCFEGIDWKSPVTPASSFDLKVNKEAIVSAGTYNTPRLLELSGIGNRAILSQFNIPTIVDLPTVGENLQEHPYVMSDFIVKEGVFTFDRLRNDPTYEAEQLEEYRNRRTGAYATTVSLYGFIKLKNFLTTEEVDELKTELENEIHRTSNPFHKRQLEIQREYLEHDGVGNLELAMFPKIFASEPKENTSYISLLACISHPVARGSVHIASADPLEPPSINPQYLNNLYDMKILSKAAQFVRKLSETAPLKDIIVAPSTPGPEVQTEAQFESFVCKRCASMKHPIGTAAMAPESLGGVVDEKLRVYGTQNVRVVDMSIAPLQLAAHLLDTAYAIGEKASDLIKAARKAEQNDR